MEPVSLAASIITLIGTAKAAETASRSLLLVKHAKTELEYLNNELVDLCAILALVQKAADRFKKQANEDEVELILAAVRRASAAIDEVKDAVEKKYSKRNGTVQEVRRLGFLKRDRWRRLHRDLKDSRENLRWTLSAMASFQVNEGLPRLELAISSITTIASPTHARPVSIVHEVQGDATTVIESIAQEASRGATDDNGEIASTNMEQVTSVVKVTDNTPMIRIAASSVQQCYRFCPCQCHTSRVTRSPKWIRGMIGTLFYQYTASPAYTRRPCDYELCKATKSSTTFEYIFPRWIGPWILNIHGAVDQLGSWAGVWNLRAPVYILGPALRIKELVSWSSCDRTQVGRFMARFNLPPYAIDPTTGKSLLDLAVGWGDLDICHFLLDQGADLFHKSHYGQTTAEFLGTWLLSLDSDGDFTAASLIRRLEVAGAFELFEFTTPHRIVTRTEHASIDSWLLSHPEDIEAQDARGNTPLIWAARTGNHNMVQTLLRFGATVSARNHYGKTPLHAAMFSNPASVHACCRTLIEAGADVNADNGMEEFASRCPLQSAASLRDYEIVNLLLDNGANPNPPGWPLLSIAASFGDRDILERLLRSNTDLDRQDFRGISPLMSAVGTNHYDCVELLIQKGARLDLRDKHGNGILWYAVRAGAEVLRLLSTAGIQGEDLDSDTRAYCWELFERYRESEFLPRQIFIEEERLAYQELLDSVDGWSKNWVSEDDDSEFGDSEDGDSQFGDSEDGDSEDGQSEDEFADAVEEFDLP